MVSAYSTVKSIKENQAISRRWLFMGLIIVFILIFGSVPLLAESRLVVDQAGLFFRRRSQ